MKKILIASLSIAALTLAAARAQADSLALGFHQPGLSVAFAFGDPFVPVVYEPVEVVKVVEHRHHHRCDFKTGYDYKQKHYKFDRCDRHRHFKKYIDHAKWHRKHDHKHQAFHDYLDHKYDRRHGHHDWKDRDDRYERYFDRKDRHDRDEDRYSWKDRYYRDDDRRKKWDRDDYRESRHKDKRHGLDEYDRHLLSKVKKEYRRELAEEILKEKYDF